MSLDSGAPDRSGCLLLGDHGKTPNVIAGARQWFMEENPLGSEGAIDLPSGQSANMGMHYSFDAVLQATKRGARAEHPWARFIQEHLFSDLATPPGLIGLSLMGPAQVLFGLVVAQMAHQRWPGVPVIAGGTHLTLLASAIAAEVRYGDILNGFVVGPGEEPLVETIDSIRRGNPMEWSEHLLLPGHIRTFRRPTMPMHHLPQWRASELQVYGPEVTLPTKVSAGCPGCCTFCTYTAVEPYRVAAREPAAVVTNVASYITETGVRRFSFKDAHLCPNWMQRFAKEASRSRLKFSWSTMTRISGDLVSVPVAQLAQCGLVTLEFGLDTQLNGTGPGDQRPLVIAAAVTTPAARPLMLRGANRLVHFRFQDVL